MKLSRKMKIELFILLMALNFILRQSTPHEIGMDSFIIHILANSVNVFGSAKWWLNIMSIFGLYPYSEESAVPFLLSGISQTIYVNMYNVTWLFCVIIGLFSIFAAYILAGKIINDDFFKFLVAFGFSTSPGVLNYSTWTVTARGLFITLLPIFIYLLLKCRVSIMRYSLLTFIFFILLYATHNLVFFTIPIIVGYFVVVISYKLKTYIKFVKIPKKFFSFVIFIGFIGMFAIPIYTGRFIIGSRYEAAINVFFSDYPRYIGILYIFFVGGFIYLLLKPNKRFEEWSLLFILLFLAPFSYIPTYIKWFILIFAFLLIGMGLTNFVKLYDQKKKYALYIIVIFLLLSISFSGFYQFLHEYKEGMHKRYMDETTYTTGLWIKENINGSTISNDRVISVRIFAISEVPLFTGFGSVDQVYDFVNVSDLRLESISITEDAYWYSGQYKIVGGHDADDYWQNIMRTDYDRIKRSILLSRFNFTHVIENKNTQGAWLSHHGVYPSEFLRSLYNKKDSIYDNGMINIWYLI